MTIKLQPINSILLPISRKLQSNEYLFRFELIQDKAISYEFMVTDAKPKSRFALFSLNETDFKVGTYKWWLTSTDKTKVIKRGTAFYKTSYINNVTAYKL